MSVLASVTISVVELSQVDQSVLQVAATLLERAGVKAKVLAQGDISGNIVLVDVDSPTGRDFCTQFDYARNRALLLLSSDSLSNCRSAVLRKPIRVQTLKDTLYDIFTNLTPTFKEFKPIVGLPVIDEQPSQKSTTPIVFDADKNLFFLLLKVREQRQVMQVFCSPHSPFYVDGQQGLIATSASREVLRKMTRGEVIVTKASKLANSDFEILAKGQLIISLINVLWSAALYNSQGQLIPGHSLETPVQLRAWPNFTRVEFEPEHLQLAAMMANHTHTLNLRQIAQLSQLPLTTVVGFYNAAWTMGLIATQKVVPTAVIKPKPIKQSLFTKIANRLKLGIG